MRRKKERKEGARGAGELAGQKQEMRTLQRRNVGKEKMQDEIRLRGLGCSCQSVDQQVHDFSRELSRSSGKKAGVLGGYLSDCSLLLSSFKISLATYFTIVTLLGFSD